MITPGTSKVVTLDPGVGTVASQTLNPPSPVEAGRTVSGGVATGATTASTLPQSW